jgi:hypothetical protein
MKLAVFYSTKNQVNLTLKTLRHLCDEQKSTEFDIIWCDGSTDPEALGFLDSFGHYAKLVARDVRGGADAAIAWKLTTALQSPKRYSHIMLLENDVLLGSDAIRLSLDLFDVGSREGLNVGAVSPRSYVDRILIQRDGFAVMHNIGAGAIIFTREAADIVLRTFRTGWWPSVRYGFAQVSGIDIGAYACFAGNSQPVTTDWQFEYQMLRYGLCALALTPARCEMIGQNPPLAEQGLELTTGPVEARRKDEAFKNLAAMTKAIRQRKIDASQILSEFYTQMGATLFFPHQVGKLFAQQQGWRLKWTQGHGPFSYVAGPGGASLSVRICGSCSFLLSGGEGVGANVSIADTHSGFRTSPELPPFQGSFVEVSVPGGFAPRTVALGLSEGGMFYGVSCADPQLLDASYSFDWSKLPEV